MALTRKLPSELLQRCRELRESQTDAESKLWRCLKNRQLFGAKFRRQHPLKGYILDFYCPEFKLAVELDGGGHALYNKKYHDEKRADYLKQRGINVLRFWNSDVFGNLEGVLLKIAEHLHRAPLPGPPPRGGRG